MSAGIDPDDISVAVKSVFGAPPGRVAPLVHGRNSQGFRVDVAGRTVFAKQYFSHPDDPRDRLGAEWGMLTFLWQQGVRCVPEPVAVVPDLRIGFYRFVDGLPLRPGEVGREDVLAMAGFLGELTSLRTAPDAAALPYAADVLHSLDHGLHNVAARMTAVRECATRPGAMPAFTTFVEDELSGGHDAMRTYVADALKRFDVDGTAALDRSDMTLNPADHSFINVLRAADGTLTFIDFEYAGWDDPVPMICNPCLQPEIPVPDAHVDLFVRTILDRIDAGPALAQRMVCAYPLLAFKWVLIVLNEFLPVSAERRAFAGTRPEERLSQQLAKSQRLLQRLLTQLDSGTPFERFL